MHVFKLSRIVFVVGVSLLQLNNSAQGAQSQDAPFPADKTAAFTPLIDWLLSDGAEIDYVPFREVVYATSGKRMLPFNAESELDQNMRDALLAVLEALLVDLQNTDHPVHEVGRINEVSGAIEDYLQNALEALEGYSCSIPVTSSGTVQRSGYPDLEFRHEASGRIFYLDPKVHKAGSETSSFRTFYFEPKRETNKINADATHLIVGLAHEGNPDGRWRFVSCQLVDLYDFEVRLKAEFQASNRELYRDEAQIGRVGK